MKVNLKVTDARDRFGLGLAQGWLRYSFAIETFSTFRAISPRRLRNPATLKEECYDETRNQRVHHGASTCWTKLI